MATYTKSTNRTGLRNAQIKLSANQVFSFENRRGNLNIQAESGTLWVTFPNDLVDYVLQPGERLPVRRHGAVVLEAISDACFRVQ